MVHIDQQGGVEEHESDIAQRQQLHRRGEDLPKRVPGEFRICRHFRPRVQEELSQSFDFPIFKRDQIEPGLYKGEHVSPGAERLLSPIRLPDAHHCTDLCRYWRLIESATMLLPSI